jgi:stage II sporulation protein M
MYSLPSVALDNLSGAQALKRSFHVATGNLKLSLAYAFSRIVSVFLVTLLASYISSLNVPLTSLASIAITLLFVPVLHLSKTLIYSKVSTQTGLDTDATMLQKKSALRDLFGGPFFFSGFRILLKGLRELKNYVSNTRNIPYHCASALSFAVGIPIGAYVGSHGLDQAILALGYAPGQINPTILKDIPLSAGLDIFLHNWQVSLSTALSGLWLVAPSLVTLAFNGMILGIVYYLTPNFTMFAAAIFPHGVIEIPSFVIAGSTGVKLGVTFVRARGKPEDSPEQLRFFQAGRETIYVVIGLAVLFFFAGFIEGNVTPIIMRMYGWK